MYLQIVRFPASLSKSLQLTRHPIICEFSNCAFSYISFHIHCNWLVLRSFVNFKLFNKKFQKLFIFGGFWQDQNFQQDSHQDFIFKTNIFETYTEDVSNNLAHDQPHGWKSTLIECGYNFGRVEHLKRPMLTFCGENTHYPYLIRM